jgi:hypothetical protein
VQPRDSHPLLWVLGDINGKEEQTDMKGQGASRSPDIYQHVRSTASHGSSSYHQGTDLALFLIIEWIEYLNVT